MIKVRVITPNGLYLESDAIQINACSKDGEFGLLSDHMPMVAMLEISKLEVVKENNDIKEYALSGGMLQFKDNKVNILTDSIEGEDEIDIVRAQEAKARAEKRLQQHESDVNMRRAEIALRKAINRINVKSDK
ncbi:F-type H+-transporting ATPase subunit epsilon [Breznakia sp. PF5-3]|uniref:F0F1 ATP synthase subunit epsilon n=1 Tax=unclassified Breznakia TaxID=2623764 RepID=UPI002405F827|nr:MULTISPECIES: F0F1 ATP synthase subunit epsilon [unclassified Breznakia]MDL2276675.1 F0F1 ATP synthase subunit epsilon [Breznakia sp. OttesenSCG-928-G09]MDF9825726.1 F-type H+-transporting ATPase subunit epsilon [Breznakia sp. PM6-1]MDF9836556.1 F-type H+-transporting ATPase subunit epsilon [Breznakia sp. PF5-3]MDF9838333.1 F-type H+-transporting ATPase subunit epsilon [Breznakia sp. PFB2-8]MDF9860375.1 F-type H+-transporting ATPase subunit epsilon [Breznakia sp. PH5-24]